MITKDTKFLIVGLGLIGGSYAMGLKKQGYHVDAIDINQLSIDFAIKNNIIDHGSTFDIELIQKYAVEVDNALRPIGFKRTASRELYDPASTMIQKIMTFEAMGLEEFI